MRTLKRFEIKNFKSIKDQSLALGDLNVFIGGNGAGKSNLISAFRFLKEIVNQNLAAYTAIKGGADGLLFFGRKVSRDMSFFLEFAEGNTSNSYRISLAGTDDDALLIVSEIAYYHDKIRYPSKAYDLPIASAARESKLRFEKHICATQVLKDLESYRVYHFHDTSDTASVKAYCSVEDNRFLRPQAENLAAFLFFLKEKHGNFYENIEATISQIAPFFGGFSLAPSRLNEEKIRLEWREAHSDAYFNANAFSDGTLRFICLATLLLQPELPPLVLLDEPELGLHPAAITLLADLLVSASTRTQVVVATQSVTLVNQLEPKYVWAVDRQDTQSVFRHLAESDMSDWLDDYALGELWEKNVLGARP